MASFAVRKASETPSEHISVAGTQSDLISVPSPSVHSEDVRRLLASYTKEKGQAGADNAYSTYVSDWGSNPSQETIKKTIVAIGTDYIFLVPTQAALYLHASNAR